MTALKLASASKYARIMAKNSQSLATDGLANAITGMGTQRDPRTRSCYVARPPMTRMEIHAALSASGLIRKIVTIPAFDAVREWRDWKAEQDQIALLEAEEARLGLRQKVQLAETLRALGGGALIMGLPGNPSEPARPASKGSLAFVNVVSRWSLTFEKVQGDPTKEGFGEPLMWKMNTAGGAQVSIHPSRVIPFRADTTTTMIAPTTSLEEAFWGTSVVEHVLDAVQDSDTARSSFAALLHKARLLRIGIPGLIDLVSTQDGEAQVMKRISLIAQAESIHNATIYDSGDVEDGKGGEKIEDAQYNFSGAKDVLNAYAEFACAVSDIPATRLLGRAPEGMNSSGDSQQKDWGKKIRAQQTLQMAPCLARLDAHLIPSALGSRPPEIWYEFAPLDAPDEDKAATRFKTLAEALKIILDLNAMPEVAFNKAVQATLVEGGMMPGLDAALAEIPEAERWGINPDPNGPDPMAKGGDPASGGAGGANGSSPPARTAANDATPRPLYVYRKLLNGDELAAWAKSNGFASTLAPSDMHVTVLYSRMPVDPMAMGEGWGSDQDGGLIIKAGGPRALERFGEGAVVLQFASWSLQSRHNDMVQAGASHDYQEYLPHVTLTYDGAAIDIEAIKPFSGELRFGAEIFEPLDLDLKAKVQEA